MRTETDLGAGGPRPRLTRDYMLKSSLEFFLTRAQFQQRVLQDFQIAITD